MESMNLSPHGKPHMGAIPSLDRLLADPAAFNLLPADTQNAVYAQVAALEAAFRAKILTRGRDGPAPLTNEPDRAVRIEEAMGLLGMTKDYLYRHWEKLGGYRDDDGHVKFPMSTIRRQIQRAQGLRERR
jgi:predicted DNA-binding transcriptional regulator AlpA